MRSDATPSPSADTLYAKIFAFGDIPFRLPSAASTPATCVPRPSVSNGELSFSMKS